MLWTSTFTRDVGGRVTQVAIADGRPRTVYYINDAGGQVMKRWETSSASTNPLDNAFYFNGRRVAGNGGTYFSHLPYSAYRRRTAERPAVRKVLADEGAVAPLWRKTLA
ncbi:MAG: hypothetical protein Q8L23_14015 [Caulobacter sp.]|nr:hypothetical protein [Caulobacter sp.]